MWLFNHPPHSLSLLYIRWLLVRYIVFASAAGICFWLAAIIYAGFFA